MSAIAIGSRGTAALGTVVRRRVGLPAAAWLAAAALLAAGPAAALEWEIEVVEPAILLIESGLALDLGADGTPHIAHSLPMDFQMHYLVRVGGVWVREYPAETVWVGTALTMALDPAGAPWLVYGDGSGIAHDLYVARKQDGQWTVEPLPDAVAYISNCGMAFSADGVPHIAYGNGGGLLRHGWRSGGQWHLEDADLWAGTGFDIGLALDSQGRPYISHWQWGLTGGFAEACTWWDGSAWQRQILDTQVGDWSCIHSGIALDAQDDPHIAWESHFFGAPVALRYATRTAQGWQTTTIHEALSDGAAGCRLVLDRTGEPHVVYGTYYITYGGDSDLRYAHRDADGNWVHELIDAEGDAGELNSLEIDAQGYLHVAYYAGNGLGQFGEIRYARSKQPVGGVVGDLNCDGKIDAFDIDPFVLALTDPAGYAAKWPACDYLLADVSGDGKVDAFDVDPFVELLTGG